MKSLKKQIEALALLVISAIVIRVGNGVLLVGWRWLRSTLGATLSVIVVIAGTVLISVVIAAIVGPLRSTWRLVVFNVTYMLQMLPYWALDLAHLGSIGLGRAHCRFSSEEQFYIEDPRRRPGRPDTEQSDFGVHWRDGRKVGGQRLTWIEATTELIFVGQGYGQSKGPVEIITLFSSEWLVEQQLKGWEYACLTPHGMRWVRHRAHGWRVPLPPKGRNWLAFDNAPIEPWPSPTPPSMSKKVGSYHGIQGDDDNVFVEDSDGRRLLYHYVRHSPTGMSWGYGGSGPSDLARSMLADRLGYVPSGYVWRAFRTEVIAELDPEFILKFSEVDYWIDGHKHLFAKEPRAEPFDPYAAGGQY